MNKVGVCKSVAVLVAVAFSAGCAGVRPIPDPRYPAPVVDSPVLLRACFVDGDGAHAAVGDQVEITTTEAGRLTIRHIPGPDNKEGAWNGGAPIKVSAAVLVEQSTPRGAQKNTRRFVPVGRFTVRIGQVVDAPFDFQMSKATAHLTGNRFPECNVDLGADEVIVRGLKNEKRQGGEVHLR